MHGGCILFTSCHFYMMESVALVIIHNWSGNDMHCHLADLRFYYFVNFFGWTMGSHELYFTTLFRKYVNNAVTIE